MANVGDILRRVYGFRGLPFPAAPAGEEQSPIAGDFSASPLPRKERNRTGTPLWGQNALGRPVFMPAILGGIELQNPLITISGEKEIIETDVTEAVDRNGAVVGGTVFEKVFQRPYDITIICTLIGTDNLWPEAQLNVMERLFTKGTLYTLECVLTDIFLQPRDNFILKRLDVLDMQGVENAQVVQLTGRSNIDFELILI